MISRLRSPNVFVNVPFDDKYEPLFEALVFTISACGYRVRCALEGDGSGDIRLDKLVELIRECPRSIHDLSRIEPGENDLPRFNMPFELGLALGARRFGHRPGDRIKIMVADPYRLPAYLSDLGGNDPSAHRNDPQQVIRIVSTFLQRTPVGGMLPRETSGRLSEVQGATSQRREGYPLSARRDQRLWQLSDVCLVCDRNLEEGKPCRLARHALAGGQARRAPGAKMPPVVADWEPNHNEVARHTRNTSGETKSITPSR
jgi:hypothetical protein